ncbi:MAG: hypothetical protein AAF513_19525 [Pseudomonadota bacterium]
MSERQVPDLSTSEGSGYRRSGGSRKARSSQGGGSGRGIGTSLVMAILIAGLAVAGWFIANQQQSLQAERSNLAAATDRLDRLEQRLSATDSAMSQGGEDTQEKIGLWESEIRKLWAVSNERNKKWIQDNQTAVKKLNTTLGAIESASRDLETTVGRHESAFGEQQQMVDKITSMELQLQQLVRSNRDLVDKMNAANQAVAGMRATLKDTSEGVESMDAYRVALNSRLNDIERRLNGVVGGPAAQ